MRFFSFAFILAFFLSCSGENKTGTGTPANGKQIYEENCTICHGSDGKAGISGAKDLSTSTMSEEEALAIIENGKTTMTPFKDVLNEEQRKAVAAYIQQLKNP